MRIITKSRFKIKRIVLMIVRVITFQLSRIDSIRSPGNPFNSFVVDDDFGEDEAVAGKTDRSINSVENGEEDDETLLAVVVGELLIVMILFFLLFFSSTSLVWFNLYENVKKNFKFMNLFYSNNLDPLQTKIKRGT